LIFIGGPIGYGARSAAGLLIPMKFLQFSRGDEREADYLGLQYLYKTGYDPQAFVDFFEKIQAREKNRPGSLAKAFSTHPLTPERIDLATNEMKTILPPRDEYIVTTGEFERVSARLKMLQNRGRVDDAKEGGDRPTLRRRTTAPPAAADKTDPSSSQSGSSSGDSTEKTEDDRPTLKRR
jgi:predicted Zn-dependent protease